MNGRERVLRTLSFERPDRAPRDLWLLGCIPKYHQAELGAVQERFPNDLTYVPVRYGRNLRYKPAEGSLGRHTDEWGCTFEYLEEGVHGEVINPVLGDWSTLASFRPPYELLEGVDVSLSHEYYRQSDKFCLCGSTVQPWQRIMFLRGFANAMVDVAEESPEFLRLLGIVHEYYARELRLLAPVSANAIVFKDDWGTQTSLLISPAKWRKHFKPLYAEYCRICHEAGKFVFFHSDGEISSIYPDLIEIGIDAVNSQLFCMDIEGLAGRFRGKITLWGEIDRQQVMAFGTPADVRAAVRRVRRAWDDGRGGLIAQCEWGNDNTRENVEAVFEAWNAPLESL